MKSTLFMWKIKHKEIQDDISLHAIPKTLVHTCVVTTNPVVLFLLYDLPAPEFCVPTFV
jgi:hypothetical protein